MARTGRARRRPCSTWLAAHPSTAKFIATKLAKHFIADDPPADAVAALADTFRTTGGDLTAVTTRLIDLDAAWERRRQNIARPMTGPSRPSAPLGPVMATAPSALCRC